MLERIAYSTDLGMIAMITALLDGEGIEVPDFFRSSHVSIAGIDHGFYVHVRRRDAERAREALANSDFAKCVVGKDKAR